MKTENFLVYKSKRMLIFDHKILEVAYVLICLWGENCLYAYKLIYLTLFYKQS